jgi:formylglycine-generating enzyme required for sulfatase activity
MKTWNIFCVVIVVAATFATAQQLQVDSVNVDTIWNSDSSWYNSQGILKQRYSRDLYLSFKPMPFGGGMARCFVAISIDSGKTWIPSYDSLPSWDSLIVLDSGIASLVQCGTMGRVKLRVLGQDRPDVAFKVTAQQWQPIIAGNPQQVTVVGILTALTPGDSCSVNLQCNLDNVSQGLSFAPIAKVWWGAFGTGTWSDSTATLSYKWLATVPSGASGQKKEMIAKARDANGLWSAPCTLTVQFVELTRLLTMASIPAGTFQMGDTNANLLNQGSGSSPLHSVTLGAFTMSQTLVTQEQYQAVMDSNPAYFDSGKTWPVEQVSWYDAALFCNALSIMAGKDTVYNYAGDGIMDASVVIDYSKNGFRLPTEAEYEYAYRAGTTTDYYWGRNYPPITTADTLAMDSNAVWYYDSPDGTHPVATKKQNLWGLYDMAGNLWEWCNDWYGSYSSAAATNPGGPKSGSDRVLRGGSWSNYGDDADLCAAFRNGYGYPEEVWYNYVGFRIVCGVH